MIAYGVVTASTLRLDFPRDLYQVASLVDPRPWEAAIETITANIETITRFLLSMTGTTPPDGAQRALLTYLPPSTDQITLRIHDLRLN